VITIWVLLFLCAGQCDGQNSNSQMLGYFPSSADCEAAAKRYGEQETNDGMHIDGPGETEWTIRAHEVNPRKLHGECYQLRLDHGIAVFTQ